MRRIEVRIRRRLRPQAAATCGEVARALQPYLDGEVDATTLRFVSRHLDECRRCGLEAKTYRALKRALRRAGDPPTESLDRLRAFAERLASREPRGNGGRQNRPSGGGGPADD